MNLYIENSLTTAFIIFSHCAICNDSVYIKLDFAASLPLNKFEVIIKDGINTASFSPAVKQYWEGKLHAPWGYVEITYADSDSTYLSRKYFFKEKETYLCITKSEDKNEYFSIEESLSNNLTSYANTGGSKLDSFTKKELNAWRKFALDNNSKIGKDAEVTQKLIALSDSVLLRRLAFIKSYPDLYISSWTFGNIIAKSDKIAADTLLKLFNDLLPDSYKKSRAGIYTKELIRNKINISSNAQFPSFSVVDTKGQLIESSHLKDRYVLIQIWASWCKPCIEELPVLKVLNEKYKNTGFKLLSFSIDEDSTAFKKAIGKYSMTWPQVLDSKLYNSLGGGAIPKIYLLDKSGKVIYNRAATKDYDLALLSNLLSDRLAN